MLRVRPVRTVHFGPEFGDALLELLLIQRFLLNIFVDDFFISTARERHPPILDHQVFLDQVVSVLDQVVRGQKLARVFEQLLPPIVVIAAGVLRRRLHGSPLRIYWAEDGRKHGKNEWFRCF